MIILVIGGCAGDLLDSNTLTDEVRGSGAVLTPPGVFSAVGMVTPAGCSGTLISDDTVVTAAHCVCSAVPADCNAGPTQFTLTNVHRVDAPDILQSVTFTGQAISHPDMFRDSSGYLWQDIAVLKLLQPVSQVVLDASPIQAATSAPSNGQTVTMVGYGLTGTPCGGAYGTKRHATTTINSILGGGWQGVHVRTKDSERQDCPGDSGGPLIDGGGRIVGVASTITGGDITDFQSTYYSREWLTQQLTSPYNRFRLWAFNGGSPASLVYTDKDAEPDLIGFTDADDRVLRGDFMGLGHDQLLMINKGAGDGSIVVADLVNGQSQAPILFKATKSQEGLIGWADPSDRLLVGDFIAAGHDQLLAINTSGVGGRIAIFDFSDGSPPLAIPYWESYGFSTLFNGWHDSNDVTLVGDFTRSGHDQVLFINRGGSGGRVMIADFSAGLPAQVAYWESYGDSFNLNGWHDSNDAMIAGDFRGLGYDQVLFINRGGSGGRVAIFDFSDGHVPAEFDYLEYYGQSSLFDGWDETTDTLLAGDFTGEGFDQLLLVNTTPPPWNGPGRFLVADFRGPTATVRFLQYQGQDPSVESRIDTDDRLLAGRFRGGPSDVLLTVERYAP